MKHARDRSVAAASEADQAEAVVDPAEEVAGETPAGKIRSSFQFEAISGKRTGSGTPSSRSLQ